MKRKKLIISLFLILSGLSAYADTRWLDTPFHDMMQRINALMTYFMHQTEFIAGIILFINLVMLAIKVATTGSGVKDEMVKTVTAIVIYMAVFSHYPQMLKGINNIVYKWALNSTYNTAVDNMLNEFNNSTGIWADEEKKKMFSDIIKQKKNDEGVTTTYIDLTMPSDGVDSCYMSPSSCMQIILLVMNELIYKMDQMPRMTGYLTSWIPADFIGWLLLLLSMLWAVFCGICANVQYFITCLEFLLIMGVGVIFLPCMIWNSTKFLTEKLVGALLGFFVKFLFVSIGFMLTMTGYLDLAMRDQKGSLDMFIYVTFVSLFYALITMNGPKLAQSLLTGQPQMSMGEAMQAVGAAAFGATAAKNVAKSATSPMTSGVKKFAQGKSEQHAAASAAGRKQESNIKKGFMDTQDTSTPEKRKEAEKKWNDYKSENKDEIKNQKKQAGAAAKEETKEAQKAEYKKQGGALGTAVRLANHYAGMAANPLQTMRSGRTYQSPQSNIDINRIASDSATNPDVLPSKTEKDFNAATGGRGPVAMNSKESKGIGPYAPVPFAAGTKVEGPSLPYGPQPKNVQKSLDGQSNKGITNTPLQTNYNAATGGGPVAMNSKESKGIGPYAPVPFAAGTKVEGPSLPYGPQSRKTQRSLNKNVQNKSSGNKTSHKKSRNSYNQRKNKQNKSRRRR